VAAIEYPLPVACCKNITIIHTVESKNVSIFGILKTMKGGETGMKKTLSESVLIKEAALWEKMKEAVQKHPATVCHK
jgi:hypothetical protein